MFYERSERIEKQKQLNTNLKSLMKKCFDPRTTQEFDTEHRFTLNLLKENDIFLHLNKIGFENYINQTLISGNSICSEARAFIEELIRSESKLNESLRTKVYLYKTG